MKLNGALKPRQGASRQGSSPGVVLKKYRFKRYIYVNENVVNNLPLSECGGTYKNLTESNIINSNNICINNQKLQATTQLSQQLEPKRKSGEGEQFSRSISNNSLSRINLSTLMKTKKLIFLTTPTRVSAVTKIKGCHYNLYSGGSKNKLVQIAVASATAAEEALAEAVVATNKQSEKRFEIGYKQRGVINITTRQINNTKINKTTAQNKTKSCKSDEREGKQVNHNVTSNKATSTPKEANKLLFFIISRLFIQLEMWFFSVLSHAKKHLGKQTFALSVIKDRGSVGVRSNKAKGSHIDCVLAGYNSVKMMPAFQMLKSSFERICFKNAIGVKPSIALSMVIYIATAILLSQPVVGEDGDTFFPNNGLETTTPEFDYASRGQKKFGDKCDNTLECGFPGSICDPKKKSCQCTEDLPVTNHIDKCGKEAAVNESCFFNEQCEVKYFQTECRDQRCVCRFDMTPIWLKDGSVECKGRGDKKGPETYIDPAMIGVLIGMALMFIIICVVLRLFSQARWRENRTIFNTPNPRLMNVSLLRESKLLHGQERRGSRMSVRAPSRQPSMASLRPHSPNPSLGKTGSRSNSHGSNASATSLRSTRSNSVSPAGIPVGNNSHHERKGSTYQPHQHHHPQQQQKLQPLQQEEEQHLTQTNITSNPVAETVTVEIIEPEK